LRAVIEIPPRIRVRYTKTGRIKYTSQRDNARAWERALRRARLPVAYSEGFSPRPLLSFSLALPTGCESEAEYTDLRFGEAPDGAADAVVGNGWTPESVTELGHQLGELLPGGLDVVATAALEGSGGSLQEEVTSCFWIVEVTGMSAAQLTDRVEALLSAAQVPIERVRKGRKVIDDLRPSVLSLTTEGTGSSPGTRRLLAELATKPRGVRPAELLAGIDPAIRLVRASRTAQWIDVDGNRHEPLTTDGRVGGAAAEMATERGR